MDSTPEPLPVPDDPTINPPEAPVLLPPTEPNSIFIGPFGLRAGWSLLIYIAILLSIVSTVRAVHDHVKAAARQAEVAAAQAAGKPAPPVVKRDPNAPSPVSAAIAEEGISFAVLFLVSLIMAAIERRRFQVYGLGGERIFSRFFTGTLWGLIAMAMLVGTLNALHLVRFEAQLDHGWAIAGWGGAQLAGFLCVGLVEEYLFRGYLQFTLARGLVFLGSLFSRNHARTVGFWIATLITSGLFFAAHISNDGEDWLGLVLVFLAGVAFVLALWRTGSLWWGIGFHMAWDWSQSFLYGVPDSGQLVQGRLFATHAVGNPLLSGGPVGPEGSVLCVPVLLLIIVVLFRTRRSPLPGFETKGQVVMGEARETIGLEGARV
jgi:hypothetical protein